jgi:tol-pal system protein YbgF
MLSLQWMRRGIAAAALALLAVVWQPMAPAFGQSSEVRGLISEIERLRRDLDTLQRYVYAGWKPPAGEAPQAEAPQEAQVIDTQAARLQVRITELETELRNMTGRIEEVGFKIDKVRTRLDKLVEDVDFRLSTIERGLAAHQPTAGLPGGASAPAQPTSDQPPEGGQVATDAPQPAAGEGVLGTVSASDMASAGEQQTAAVTPAPQPQPESILPAGTADERYNFAMRLLRQGDWNDAELALVEFLAAHPDHQLASNAQYWLGETYYVRDQFRQAAETFLAGYKQFGDGPKAPGSLLKLGMSLAKLGEVQEACTTFDAVRTTYRDTDATIVRLAERERQSAGCN